MLGSQICRIAQRGQLRLCDLGLRVLSRKVGLQSPLGECQIKPRLGRALIACLTLLRIAPQFQTGTLSVACAT